MEKKLFKDQRNGRIGGVCAGLAQYFEMDVNITRLIAVVIALSGPGAILYFVAMAILPNKMYSA